MMSCFYEGLNQQSFQILVLLYEKTGNLSAPEIELFNRISIQCSSELIYA